MVRRPFPLVASICVKSWVADHIDRVIESIKAGKKLPEARFSCSSSVRRNGLDKYKTNNPEGGVGVPVGQKSVYDMFNKSSTTRTNEDIG